MLISALIAASALAATTPEPKLVKAPGWLKKPTEEDLFVVYPRDAFAKGISGNVMLSCFVNSRGGIEDCLVVSETPADQGFGAAAIALLPQMLMTPGEDASGPVRSRIRIPIHFLTGTGRTIVSGGTQMIVKPVFVAAPSFDDVGAVYPVAGNGEIFRVSIRCSVKKSGELNHCDSMSSNISGMNAKSAALRLAARFRIQPDPAWASGNQAYAVDIPILLQSPTSPAIRDRLIAEPRWLQGPDPATVVRLFPAQAAAKGIATGRGVAVCTVMSDGSLGDCTPGPGDPDGQGFSEAAVQVARVMKMNLWTQEGGPVVGARFQLPIRFNLAAPPAAAQTPSP